MSTAYNNRLSFENLNSIHCIVSLYDEQGEVADRYIEFPEQLMFRLSCIGKAYDLHVTSLISIHDDLLLNSTQCEGLIEELAFIEYITNDTLLHKYTARIQELAYTCLGNRKLKLYFGGN
ncbi:hypothetical protein [Hymenobacter metallilatus]|uniref:Uncharacterized protein n=1 Tax=Hymenobacter metallilatus TaxID=2493666 RepID=A0A428JLP0_9BACT|nr:hypothetical protein [Hymenobacter metallilatus]RSK33878.1 hypothetical protein EI290_09230 [Hymenobacter metallilatus]